MDPAIAFATTYYYGFVKLVCEAIDAGREIEIGQNVWRDDATRQARLRIIMPDDLQISSKARTAEISQRFGLREALIRCPDRTRVALALPDSLTLTDIPSVLDTIRYIHPPSIAEPERAKVESEALTHFRQEITRLIAGDDICRHYAAVHGWDWWQSVSATPRSDS